MKRKHVRLGLVLQQVARFSELPLDGLTEKEAEEFREDFLGLVEAQWRAALGLPLLLFSTSKRGGALEELRDLQDAVRPLVHDLLEGRDPDRHFPERVDVRGRLSIEKRDRRLLHWLVLDGPDLVDKVLWAVLMAVREWGRPPRFLRCPNCGRLGLVKRQGRQRYCSASCEKNAAERRRVRQGRAAEAMARSRFARRFGVPLAWVRTMKGSDGKRRYWIDRSKGQ